MVGGHFLLLGAVMFKETIPASSSSGNTSLDLVVDRMLLTIVLSSISILLHSLQAFAYESLNDNLDRLEPNL